MKTATATTTTTTTATTATTSTTTATTITTVTTATTTTTPTQFYLCTNTDPHTHTDSPPAHTLFKSAQRRRLLHRWTAFHNIRHSSIKSRPHCGPLCVVTRSDGNEDVSCTSTHIHTFTKVRWTQA